MRKTGGSWVTNVFKRMIQHVRNRYHSTSCTERGRLTLWKLIGCHIWPVGLVAWFSLRVREVPGSTPGQALAYCLSKYFTSCNSIEFLVFFITGFLNAKKWAIERKKKIKDISEKDHLFSPESLNCKIVPSICLPYSVFFKRVLKNISYPGNVLF